MSRKNRIVYALTGIILACGQTDLSSKTENNGSAQTKGAQPDPNGKAADSKILKQEKVIGSEADSKGSTPDSKLAVTFAQPELNLHQGESKEVVVNIESTKPNSSVMITPPSQQNLRFEILSAQGAAMAAPIALDAAGKGSFKLKVTSLFQMSPTLVVAPGSLNADIAIAGTSDSLSFSAKLPVKVSNVALFVMSGVTNVPELPARFEFPAGTIPVFVNPPDRQVVGVMHFGDGAGEATFRHQENGANMPMGSGYCPLNSAPNTLVTPGAAISPNCLPCPPAAPADSMGTFYNHNGGNARQARTIVCKRRI